MKLSEFVLTHTLGNGPLTWEYFADVSVTTESGALWWKKKRCVRRKIHRDFAGSWHFVDDGKFTPGIQAQELERAYRATEKLIAAKK